jgi:hypothetical protein
MKMKALRWLLGTALVVIVFGIFCICLPIALWKDMLLGDLVFKIFALFISWPVAILIVTLVFFSRFQTAIDYFLRNIRSVNFPGGNVQVQSQAETKPADANTAPGTMVISPEQSEQLSRYIQGLQQQNLAATAVKQDIEQRLIQASTESIIWKFSYLNLFYVPQTKQVLYWFAYSSPQTRQSFNLAWQPYIQDSNQRGVILDVLLQFNMLKMDNMNIGITPEGHGFLQFIGMIPYTPTTN